MIKQANAIAYPRTVMIKPHYTFGTNTAMMSSWRLDLFTEVAELKLVE